MIAEERTGEDASSDAPAPQLLHQFFERRWPLSAQTIALDIPPGRGRPDRVRLTYGELAGLAAGAAKRLQSFIDGECLIALFLPRTRFEPYALQIGAMHMGAAYVSIDPSLPDARIAAIMADASPVALATDSAGALRAARLGVDPRLIINLDEEPLKSVAEAPPSPAWLSPSSLAYVIYTSGTTGSPKGVAIEHRSIANLIAADASFRFTSADRIGQSSSHAFDSSVEEIWMTLAAGAAVLVLDDDVVRSGPELVDWLDREALSVLCPTPTLLRSMGRPNPANLLPRLTMIYIGGEALPRDVLDGWAAGRRMINGYGPTECAVTAVRGEVTSGGAITIGKPVPGLKAYALDEELREVPDGELGELCLGGVALARGYLHTPELTAQKFIDHPKLGRLYRTGDLARRHPDGTWTSHGRADTQVKLRGYRVELEDIEAHLAKAAGVHAVACRLETHGARQILAAFIVPSDPANPPTPEAMRAAAANHLPPALLPSRFVLIEALPTSVSGKLNRDALPAIALASELPEWGNGADTLEDRIERAFREALHTSGPIGREADFFLDLGGDSLAAAALATALGEDPETANVTVRDLYAEPTVKKIAALARATAPIEDALTLRSRSPGAKPVLTTALQAIWLLAFSVLASWAGFGLVFVVGQTLLNALGLLGFIIAAPFIAGAGFCAYIALAAAATILSKRLLIGRYRPVRAAVWSGYYLRHWIVMRVAGLLPWRLIEGTQLQIALLRRLGARIGERVHIHRGVSLAQGGWDLLDIGDDVSLGQESSLQLVDYEDGALVIAPVALESGVTLEVRAGVGGHTRMGRNARLTALSWLPLGTQVGQGELWDGVPASRIGMTAPPPETKADLTPAQYERALIGSRLLLGFFFALPFEAAAVTMTLAQGGTADSLLNALHTPWSASALGPFFVLGFAPMPFTLLLQAWAARAMGAVPTGAISRWSRNYLKVWLKTGLVTSAGGWLSGTLMWPYWLRLAGMKVGRNCEISTIIDVVPEHVSIGDATFFADGIYLAGPRVDRGVVSLEQTRLGGGVFLGNHAVIRNGQTIPDDVLIGVSSVVDDARLSPGSAWFGQPAFEMRRRPPPDADRSVTHEPSPARYLTRVFWELLRAAIPAVLLAASLAWLWSIDWMMARSANGTLNNTFDDAPLSPSFWLIALPAVTLIMGVILPALVLLLKWLLLGRVKPGRHPLWSCWCGRWDFLYVAWAQLARPVLNTLEGTLMLTWYLRGMGARIGKGVVLGPGHSQMVDPDMLHFADNSTVQALFQAHTFEDRILKIDYVRIGAGATIGRSSVMMNGSEAGAASYVAPHAVVMKQTRLRAGRAYEGAPTRLSHA